MVIKKLRNGTYIFEKSTGMTAFFSENEERLIYEYFENGVKTEFINRLYDLGILKSYQEVIKDSEDIFLKSINVDITDSCPLKCSQCYKKENVDKFMEFDHFKKVIDEAVELNCFQIAIGGGEPLVHRDIVKMVQYVGNTQMSVSLTSSGYCLDERVLDNLILAGLNHIQISLNGATEKINKLSRDGYKYAIDALNLLCESNISFGINTVVRKDNINDLENIINMAKKLGAENINLLRYKPTKYEDYNKYALDEADIEKLIKIVRDNMVMNIKVDSAFTPFLMLLTNGKVSERQCGCGALREFINITVDGKYKPCSHIELEEVCENIYSYYTKGGNKKIIDDAKYIDNATCLDCSFNTKCVGCLAITQHRCKIIARGESECLYKR